MADIQEIKEHSERLLKIHREITDFYVNYAKSVGLTYSAMNVLAIIWEENGCNQCDITRKTYLPKQTVSAIIKSFNEKGIIEPPVESSSDKRNKVINFTPNGKEFADKIMQRVRESEYRSFEKLGDEKRKNLIETIELFKNNLEIQQS